MKIFSGSSSIDLAEEIAISINLILSSFELTVFTDGERRLRVLENVVDEDVIIIQSAGMPIDQNYMELFFMIDAINRSGAKSITIVVPYLGYQRQDHVFRDGEARSIEVIIKIIESMNIDKIVVLDLHSIKIPELFSIPMIHLSALSIFANRIKKEGWNNENTILISPDMGGIRRIKQISEILDNMPFATIDKNRDLLTGEVKSNVVTGEVRNRAIIIDDMISSGKTILAGSELLHLNGVKEIIVFATHPVFSDHAVKRLNNDLITKVFVTNSISVKLEDNSPKIEIISIAELIADYLRE